MDRYNEADQDLNGIEPKGGQAVLTVLKQMAWYDAVQHEGKLATDIKASVGDREPETADVLFALIRLLEDQGFGQDTELTMQALGLYHNDEPGSYDRDTCTNPAELGAVLEAQSFAWELAQTLRGILDRKVHGIDEALG